MNTEDRSVKREDLLDYVRALRARALEQEKSQGVTAWAMFLGLVYVAWQLVPQLATLQRVDLPEFLADFSELFFFLVGSLTFIQVTRGRPTKILDERILIRKGWNGGAMIEFTTLLGLQAAASHFAVGNELQLGINKWTAVTVIVLSCLAYIYDVSFGKKGFPNPSALTAPRWPLGILDALMYALLAELIFGNLWLLAGAVVFKGKVAGDVLLTSFNCVLVALGTFAIAGTLRKSHRAKRLEEIERDLVLGVVDAALARNLLEEEFIGQRFGEWLTARIRKVRDQADALQKCAADADLLIQELQQISLEYRAERSHRMTKYLQTLQEATRDYTHDTDALVSWLVSLKLQPFVSRDRDLENVLISTASELKGISRVAVEAADTAQRKVKPLLNLERAGIADSA